VWSLDIPTISHLTRTIVIIQHLILAVFTFSMSTRLFLTSRLVPVPTVPWWLRFPSSQSKPTHSSDHDHFSSVHFYLAFHFPQPGVTIILITLIHYSIRVINVVLFVSTWKNFSQVSLLYVRQLKLGTHYLCAQYGCTGCPVLVLVGWISGHFLLSGSGSDQNIACHRIMQPDNLLS